MFLAQRLLNSSNISLNAADLSVRHRSSTLKSCPNFRNFVQASPLHMSYQKINKLFFCNFSKVYLSLLRTSSGSCSNNAIIVLLVLFKTVVIISSVKKFVHMLMGFLLCTPFYGLGSRGIILAALHLPTENVEAVHLYGILSMLLSKHSLGIGGSNAS